MSELLDRMHAARLRWVEIDGREWQLYVPVEREAYLLLERIEEPAGPQDIEAQFLALDRCLPYVRDWRGFSEADLLADGSADVPAPFDAEVAAFYLADHLAVADELARRLFEAISEEIVRAREKKKGSTSGSSLRAASGTT